MEDYLEEELAIMDERDQEHCISSDVFYNEISSLELEKAFSLNEGDSLAEAISYFKEEDANAIVIVSDEKLVGILTERDIVTKAVGVVNDFSTATVKDYMTKDPVSLREEDSMVYLFHNMHIGSFRHIPIVDKNNKPIYIASVKDAISFILNFFPEEIDNVCDIPFRGKRERESA